jgi:type I restriction enzyme S subunit
MTSEKLQDIALVTPGTSPKGELINSIGIGLPFFQGSKEFRELYPVAERYTEFPVKVANSGDVLISVRAPVGKVNIAQVNCSIGRGVMSVRAKKESEQKFIFYFLKNLQGKWDSLGSTGSVFENLSTIALNNVDIPAGLSREAIGEILFNLDQAIATNKTLSKTLEEIVQTIFKSWFIDFDPVKAKLAGEKPAGMDAAIAALFPDSMEESELGLIPKGWQVRALDEISDYLNGLAMQKFPVIDENEQIPVIKIAQLRAGNTKGADMASSSLEPKFIIKDGDILFSWSGTLEVENWAGGPGALNQHLFKVTGKNVPNWYSYLSTKSFLSFFRGIASGKATTMGHIQRGHLTESKLAIPNLELMNRATEIIEPIIALKIKASIESRHLTEIRDSLLPRLISGELQIPEDMLAS